MKKKRWHLLWSIPLLSYMGAAATIAWDGLNDEIAHADVAVVLGNQVAADGTPSARLKGRLDRAVTLYQQKWFPRIVVSGGLGKEGFDEALIMARYLAKQGVPATAIVQDPLGLNTWMTATNLKSLLPPEQRQSVLIVSQFFHLSRTRLALEKNGIPVVYAAQAHYYEWRDIYSLFREVLAYAGYWWK